MAVYLVTPILSDPAAIPALSLPVRLPGPAPGADRGAGDRRRWLACQLAMARAREDQASVTASSKKNFPFQWKQWKLQARFQVASHWRWARVHWQVPSKFDNRDETEKH